jgi:ferrous iron transport protein B
MHAHSHGALERDGGRPIILVGNPNVGKSAVFGWLTGRYVEVSNYPGTTVEVARGTMTVTQDHAPIIDTPGANSLSPRSDDERVTRDILLAESPRAVLQVADAKNLRRALLLSTQLAELGVPLALDLNMADEAAMRGVQIEPDALACKLGVPVTTSVATRRDGLEGLLDAMEHARPSDFVVRFDEHIEAAANEIVAFLQDAPRSEIRNPKSDRALALMLLSGDAALEARLNGTARQVSRIRQALSARYADPLSFVITRQRLAAVDALMQDVYYAPDQSERRVSWTERLGAWAVHPVWGVPVMLFVLILMYLVVGKLGAGILVDWMHNVVFGEWVNPLATRLVGAVIPWQLARDFLVGEYGLVTMALAYGIAIVLPIVTTFFIMFSLLEDSGYLPRLAVMVNRPFKVMGLNGKAVLPMVLGLGCDTMATMTTRILETRKERIQVTLLLALGVPCSAQLGVLMGMLAGVSPVGIAVFLAVVALTMVAVGWLAARVLPGQGGDFILELPPIRLPRLDNILIKTMARLEWYLKEVLPLFVLGTVVLFVLNVTGALALVEKAAEPLVVGLLGLPAKAADAFLIGFLRRDYGAAGLFMLARDGLMTPEQVVVSLIVITLFVPCIANLMVIIKEHGGKVAAGVAATVFPLAFGVGALVHWMLHMFGWTF